MDTLQLFDRLLASAERIVAHPHFPGKDEVVDICVEDVTDLELAGRITAEQRAVLLDVLTVTQTHDS